MNSLISMILMVVILFNGHSPVQAALKKNIAVNQVMQVVLESRKSAIIASVNQKLQKKDFYQGIFFKGEIPEIKEIADELLQTGPRIVESPKGFMIITGKGKDETRIEVEFTDFLAGKIKVAGKSLQLKGNMSYLELLQTIGPPVLVPLFEKLKEQRPKKTGLSNSLNLFVTPAWGESEGGYSTRKVLGLARLFMGGSAAAVSLAAAIGTTSMTILLGGVAILLGKIIAILAGLVFLGVVLETVSIELSRYYLAEDDNLINEVKDHFHQIKLLCEENRKHYFGENSALNEQKIKQLEGNELQKFRDFQQLWLLSRKVKKLEGFMGSKMLATLGCHQLAKENQGLKEYMEWGGITKWLFSSTKVFSSTPVEILFRRRLRPLCEEYGKIIDCFAEAPEPFGKNVGEKESVIIGGGRNLQNSEFEGLYNSLKGVLD